MLEDVRMPERVEKALSGKRIGIFGKGDSGKSTVAVLLATALIRLEQGPG